jgi:hypothetical protein
MTLSLSADEFGARNVLDPAHLPFTHHDTISTLNSFSKILASAFFFPAKVQKG